MMLFLSIKIKTVSCSQKPDRITIYGEIQNLLFKSFYSQRNGVFATNSNFLISF